MGSILSDLKSIFRHPLFVLGLAVRLALLLSVAPDASRIWYVPFLTSVMDHPSLDPWASFLAGGGVRESFPYGTAMLLVFLPLAAVAHAIVLPGAMAVAYKLTLLGVDLGVLLALRYLMDVSLRRLLVAYWLSPIVLFATYWLGLNDLVPVLGLCLGLLALKARRGLECGWWVGAAVSAKLSMVLAVPLLFIYLVHNLGQRALLLSIVRGLAGAFVVLGLPYVLSDAASGMLFTNPEVLKIWQFRFTFEDSITIYLLPFAYLMVFYLAWRLQRISFDLLLVLMGLAFFVNVLLTASSPGWYLWAMPMLVLFQARASKSDFLVMGVFGALYVAVGFLRGHQPTVFDTDIAGAAAARVSSLLGSHGLALLQTAVIGLGAVLLLTIWRQAVAQNDYFRVSRKRIVIGVAGDSGSGKDTLISSLVPLFGEHSVVTISGDDYHLWDRHRPMWQVMTHLNPRANDLDRFGHDVLALADGQTIYSRHYDHETGKSTKPLRVASRDVVIVGGLHALWLPLLRERYDLGIYLDIDEGLRRAFKVDRDVRARGHDVDRAIDALAKREPDAVKFIRPQARYADLVLALQPMNLDAAEMGLPLRLKLLVRAQHGLQEEALVRALVGLCGLHVDVDIGGDDSTVSLTIEGDSTADDMVAAARQLLPGLHELLDAEPKWCDGILGVMQLVVMAHVHQALRRRLR